MEDLQVAPFDQYKNKKGVNLIGNISAESGLGQSCRLIANELNESDYDFTIYDYHQLGSGKDTNHSWDEKISSELPYNINLIHINPHELGLAFAQLDRSIWDNRYNIAFWLWELEEFPEEWVPCFSCINEVWTPSEFISSSIRKKTNLPVKTIPYCVTTSIQKFYDRVFFQLPEDQFLYLTMYDHNSIVERKNPSGVFEAFKKAFNKGNKKVGLVIKINNSDKEDLKMIQAALVGYNNIYIITQTLDKDQVNSLIKCVNVMVSLHRSEGFGLVLAEAMLIGTPTIATNWSSNTEFMNSDIACLVDYNLIKLEKDMGPFKKGNRWADPDIQMAADYMKKLYYDKDYYNQMSKKAKSHLNQKLSIDKATELINQRISEIYGMSEENFESTKIPLKKIAIVNQRYGLEVNGGSEYYTRLIAGMLNRHYDVEILTTRALDYDTWEDYYEEGLQEVEGIKVRRFSVDRKRNLLQFRLTNLLQRHIKSPFLEMKWINDQGPLSKQLIQYIHDFKGIYDVFIFVTYLYYPTVKGLPEVADKAIFIPTAHDEPYIYFSIFQKLFALPKAIIYLTEEEKEFVNKTFHNESIPSDIIGIGIDVPQTLDEAAFREKYHINSKYVIYAGRIDPEKGCNILFQYFIKYKQEFQNTDIKLVLIGKAMMDIPKHPDIISLGFVSEEDKFNGISGAKVLILPSEYESLSISVLEAMALSVPVLVNGKCAVLKGHCDKSKGGLYYNMYEEFRDGMNILLNNCNEYEILRNNAKHYIDTNYTWDVNMKKFEQMIENI